MATIKDYEYVQGTVNAVLVVAFLATLIKVLKNTKFVFMIKMTSLLLVSNAAGVMVVIADANITKSDFSVIWAWTQAIFVFMRTTTINSAYWLFAFQYYKISRYTPYLLKSDTPPDEMVNFDDKINVVLTVLNVFFPFFVAVTLLIYNLCLFHEDISDDQTCTAWIISSTVGLFLVGLIQLISGVYFGWAVLKIRKHLIENGGKLNINVTMLLTNSAAFALYILSTLVFYVFYFIIYVDEIDKD